MSVQNIRNVALVGQAGAGKSTLIERLLFTSKAIRQMGEIERGTTVCDYDEQSKGRKHSLNPTATYFAYHHHRVNLLDTPGMAEFIGRSISILPAVETVACVIDAPSGLKATTERLFKVAGDRKNCRLLIINKIDAEDVYYDELMAELTDRIGAEVLPINLPDASGHQVVDCYFEPQYASETAFSSVQAAHDALVDQVVEVDEELMELYLEQGQVLQPEQLHDPFELALRSDHLVPVCFVSAKTGAGIDLLLRILTELMPTPLEGNHPLFLDGDKPVDVVPGEEGHALAHVFKVEVDPFMGRLAYLRVHQGRIHNNSTLLLGDNEGEVKVAHLYQMQGKERVEVSSAVAGDICAIAKVDNLKFDSVLHDSEDEAKFHLRSLSLPPPMFSLAVKTQKRGDEQKLSETLKKLTAEDPSLVVNHRVNLNETLLTGVGELHLQAAIERMEKVFNLTVQTCTPSIDYRETISKAADAVYRHKKQTGGAGQFGEVHLRVRPLPRGQGFNFVNKVVGGVIPTVFIPAVEKGIRQVLLEGAVAGFAIQDIEVEVYDGKHHAVDSKEIAFVMAGRKAFIEAVKKAGPLVLEPVCNVEISVPSVAMGDVSSDMTSHRGIITDTALEGRERTLLCCQAPASEMQDYSHRLKSITRGEGSFTMALSHFEPVTHSQQQELMGQYKQQEPA